MKSLISQSSGNSQADREQIMRQTWRKRVSQKGG